MPFCLQSPISLPVRNTRPPVPDPLDVLLIEENVWSPGLVPVAFLVTWYSNGTPELRSPGNVWYKPLCSTAKSIIAPSSSTSVTLNTATSSLLLGFSFAQTTCPTASAPEPIMLIVGGLLNTYPVPISCEPSLAVTA